MTAAMASFLPHLLPAHLDRSELARSLAVGLVFMLVGLLVRVNGEMKQKNG